MMTVVYNRKKMEKIRKSALDDMRHWRDNKGYLNKDLIRIFIANNLTRYGMEWNRRLVDSIIKDMTYNYDIWLIDADDYEVL